MLWVFLVDRKMGPWLTALSYEATAYSGWLMLGFPGRGFSRGLAASAGRGPAGRGRARWSVYPASSRCGGHGPGPERVRQPHGACQRLDPRAPLPRVATVVIPTDGAGRVSSG